jgi:two-component system, OmpR family, phosphate regulon sensor histidine kinase PhoR
MFRRRLLWELYPAYLLTTVLALFLIAWYLSHLLPEFYHNQVAEDLQARARLVEQQLVAPLKQGDFKTVESLARKLGTSSSTRITVILPSGEVVADSDEDPARMENHSSRPEFKDAIEKGIGRSLRFSSTLGKSMMYLAVPIQQQGQTLAVVRTSIPAVAMNESLRDIDNKILLSAVIAAIVAAAISLPISRTISQPVGQMKETAQRFAAGHLELRVPVPKQAELADLARTLNEMARQLQERIQTISRQRNELEAILSSMTEGVLAVDEQGHIVSINQAAAKFLGADPSSAAGRSVEEVVRNTDFQEFVRATLNTEHPGQRDVTLPGVEDRIVRLDGATLADGKGGRSGAVIVISDMTRMRRLEEVRRDFVANVSHELRTPITSIKGFVETLLEGAFRKPQEAERFLRIIAKHSDRLNAIVEDLLVLSSLEEGAENRKITLEKVPLRPVLKSVIEMSTIKAEEKQITVELDCDERIEAKINTVLLEQALLNLVDNAIKYSEPQGRTLLEARQAEEWITISVRDNGPGIARIHQDRIFERFYVVDKSRSRKLGGTGLGLAIVKHIAEVHGGHVTVESTPGAGSTFTIHLPTD